VTDPDFQKRRRRCTKAVGVPVINTQVIMPLVRKAIVMTVEGALHIIGGRG